MKRILLVVVVLMSLITHAHARMDTVIGIDVYGYSSDVVNLYYQMPLSSSSALRLQLLHKTDMSVYGFYRYTQNRGHRKVYKFFWEVGLGYAQAVPAIAAKQGMTIKSRFLVFEPFVGYVSGEHGSGVGVGLNIGLKI
ncbi:MAG: hypothetical protein HUJ30_01585 [Gammaproteobacteria bacterium]|nr:hypothetical protein [Gammaproteobacteria bacterium]